MMGSRIGVKTPEDGISRLFAGYGAHPGISAEQIPGFGASKSLRLDPVNI
jgi:hypothetical protein